MRLRTAVSLAATAVMCLWLQPISGQEKGPYPFFRLAQKGVRPLFVPKQDSLQADGQFREFQLPNPNSGPTTIAIAADGTVWFTEGTGNRIGRMAPDGTGLREFELPNPGSAPRIITIGADNNIWFTEHLGNRIGRITPAGQIVEFSIPTSNC